MQDPNDARLVWPGKLFCSRDDAPSLAAGCAEQALPLKGLQRGANGGAAYLQPAADFPLGRQVFGPFARPDATGKNLDRLCDQ